MDGGCPLCTSGGETLMSKLTHDCLIQFAPVETKSAAISVEFLAAGTQRSSQESVRSGPRLCFLCAVSKIAIHVLYVNMYDCQSQRARVHVHCSRAKERSTT